MEEIMKIIHNEAKELFDMFQIKGEIKVTWEDGVCVVVLSSQEDPAQIIGHHGEVLDSFQRILQIIAYRVTGEKVDVLLDVNGYRSRQKERLESIADRLAHRVVEDGKAAVLRSFDPYERKIIHTYVAANFSTLESVSEGEGSSRALIIRPKS